MSTPSLASNLDNISSAILDSKTTKHINSSEAFQSFLLKSPYTSPTRVLTSQPQRNTYYLRKGEEDNSQNNEDILEYLSPKKRACLQSESLSTIAPKSKRLGDGEASSLGFLDFCEAQGSSKSKLIIDDCDGENQSSATQQQMHIQRKLRAVQGYSRGFECPNMENLDKETRKYIEGLQERVVRLERDTVKLKRENYELNAKNKKYEEKMISVVQEQERFMKMREDYEKTIASLRENCQSNKVIADSLKDVLAMQEGEFYDRVVKKEKGAANSATNTKTTRSSSKVSQNRINSIPSLEAILDSQKEGKEKTERKKLSIKVNTAKSVSKSSMTSLNTRKASTLSIGNAHENCFKTAEVTM